MTLSIESGRGEDLGFCNDFLYKYLIVVISRWLDILEDFLTQSFSPPL
jgi:hypothetical protein